MKPQEITDILRAEGMCGAVSDDEQSACLLDRDHEGQHGWALLNDGSPHGEE